MPISELLNIPVAEGQDVTEVLGVQKYEKPIPVQLAGRVKGNFPIFIRKTDQERAQNILKEIRKAVEVDEMFEATLKLDGSSMTVYNHPVRNGVWSIGGFASEGKEVDIQGVCSRNWDLAPETLNDDTDRKNAFWKCANERSLVEKVKAIKTETGRNVAIQGELMGEGVQHNRENLRGLEFFCFDIWDIDTQEYLSPLERTELCGRFQISEVPHIMDVSLSAICSENLIDGLLKFANRPSYNPDIPTEGVVFRSLERRFSFKVINNEYLLQEKD